MTDAPHRRKSDKLIYRFIDFLKRFFFIIGVAATILLASVLSTLNKAANYVPPSLPDNIILTYTFKAGLDETIGKPSIHQPLLRPATTFHEVVDDLTQASKDKRVKGFVARLQDTDMAPAQIQELRDTLALFRQSGKFAAIFAEDFGGFGSGMSDYYLASAFNAIWMQPVGAVSINGLAAEVPFLKGIMDKIGVEAQFSHKGIYKSGPESLTQTGMSAPHREMMTALIDDLSAQMTAGIAQSRGLAAEEMRELVNNAPYGEMEALQKKLIDKIGYYNEMVEEAKTKAGKDAELVGLQGYSFKASTISLNQGMPGFVTKFMRKADPDHVHLNKPRIALIFGAGDIVPYRDEAHLAFGEGGMSADKIVAAFEEAQKDPDVVAVVFRVDSPGGSPSASETIRRAVIETQKKGKPVIVSMGGYAASGGYWIATPADKIVAEPATITGSIGVFGGKFVLAQLWEKLGVNWERVAAGDNAGMWSSNTGFTEKERARFEALMDNTYEAFLTRVMQGRKMTREQALAVAEGRAWTGRQAKERGLVDALGGLDVAVELAKQAAKIPAVQEVPLKRFPPQKSTLELFIQLATEGAFFTPVLNIRLPGALQDFAALKAPQVQIK